MDVACMEAEGDPPPGFVQHDHTLLDRPVSAQGPGVELQRLGRDVAARHVVRDAAGRIEVLPLGVAEVALGRAQVRPVACASKPSAVTETSSSSMASLPALRSRCWI